MKQDSGWLQLVRVERVVVTGERENGEIFWGDRTEEDGRRTPAAEAAEAEAEAKKESKLSKAVEVCCRRNRR